MKKTLFVSIIFIFFFAFNFAFSQKIEVDPNTLGQVITILQGLLQKSEIQSGTSSEPFRNEIENQEIEKKIEKTSEFPEIKIIQPQKLEIPKGVKPALPKDIDTKPITPEVIKPILPDEDRSDDVIVQINNLRITRILLDPGIQNVKAIFFVARDIGWKCMLFESEESEKSLPCVLDVRRKVLQKELAIQISNDTILLQKNRQKAKLEDFKVGDKINVYGFMDKDSNGIDALIVRNLSGTKSAERTIINISFPGGYTIKIYDSDLKREIKEIFKYIDSEIGKVKELVRYKIWEGVVYEKNKTKIVDLPSKGDIERREGKIGVYQKVKVFIYAPKGQIWFNTTVEGEMFNVTFYDFSKDSWFVLKATEASKSDLYRMKLEKKEIKPDLIIDNDKIKAKIFKFYRGTRGNEILGIYEKPISFAIIFQEETNCADWLESDVKSDCLDFYQKNILEKLNEEFWGSILQMNIKSVDSKLPTTSTPSFCIQVITPAYNPQNPLECKEFPTPCDVPSGWVKTEKCPVKTPTL